MSDEIEVILQSLKLEIGTIVFGWIILVLGLVSKDILSSFSFGITFYLNPQFTEGDSVFLDGEECIIQKIGVTTTVLRNIENERWIFIKNESIRHHKLEKRPSKFENKGD